jgi:cardiolipin synthase C
MLLVPISIARTILVLALAAAPFLAIAQRAMIVSDNVEAAAIQMDLVRGAQKSIYASMYMMNPDRSGLVTLGELRAAAQRGVDVHLMVDGLYMRKLPKDVLEAVLASGVKLYEYNPLSFWSFTKNLKRSHDKVWVVDELWTDVSDRNVSNEYNGLTKTPAISRGVIVEDQKTALDAIDYIKKSLVLENVRALEPSGDVELLKSGVAKLQRALSNPIDTYLAPYSNWKTKLQTAENLQFNHTGVGDRNSPLDLDSTLLKDFQNAKESIVIENPYIVLIPEHLKVLQEKLKSGVKVIVYTNSNLSTDNKLVYAAWEASRAALAASGAEIYEHPGLGEKQEKRKIKERLRRFRKGHRNQLFGSRTFLHAKTVVIDGVISYIMSYNLDPRSKNLNREVSIRIDSTKFAKFLGDEIRKDAKKLKYLAVAQDGRLSANAPTCSLLLRAISRIPVIRNQL